MSLKKILFVGWNILIAGFLFLNSYLILDLIDNAAIINKMVLHLYCKNSEKLQC